MKFRDYKEGGLDFCLTIFPCHFSEHLRIGTSPDYQLMILSMLPSGSLIQATFMLPPIWTSFSRVMSGMS